MLDDVNTTAPQGGADAAASSLALRFTQVKSLLQKEFGDTAFRSWIQPVDATRFSGGVLELSVPTRFVRDWVKSHYADRIRSLWQQNFGPIARVDLIISARKETVAAEPAHTVSSYAETPVANQNTAVVEDLSSPLDPRFTFANFVIGRSNELACNAAKAVAAGTSRLNPLFLQGGVGLGKTHLMQAVAHAVRAQDPSRKVAYMSAEKFMYQFVKALRAKDTMSFKTALRGIDILMVDDIQFICGKDQTQEEFIHTFNALIDQGKQIIVSADKSPAELDGLGERLRSRLGMGLVAAIQQTTPELRLEILRAKCTMLGRNVAEDVLEFLAQRIASNVRELEGALNRLIAHAELAGRALNVDTAADVLQDLLRAHERRVSVEDIQKKVAEHYGIRMADMHSPRRARPVARPRQVAMYLCKALTSHSLPEIGRKFGGRDHTTIIHGVRKVEELMAQDAALRDDVDQLKRAISG
ncbi:MAG: chromosomal replication initiator protein DnaA [Alphaproteobacteria bacterium]